MGGRKQPPASPQAKELARRLRQELFDALLHRLAPYHIDLVVLAKLADRLSITAARAFEWAEADRDVAFEAREEMEKRADPDQGTERQAHYQEGYGDGAEEDQVPEV